MTEFEKWQLVVNAVLGVSTISVAILAIWGDWIRYRLGGAPKLTLVLRDPHGDLVSISQGDSTSRVRYYHLLVANDRKWTLAHNVRVVIVEYLIPVADGSLVSQPLSGPLQLMWQFALVNPNPMYRTVGQDAICDLGYIIEGEDFKLATYYEPSNFDGSLSKDKKMRLIVQAMADNAVSNKLSVDIAWNGRWSEGTLEMANNLIIKQST